MNPDVAQRIADITRGEEIKNENKIHLARMMILAIMATMMTIFRGWEGKTVHETFLVIAPASIFYLFLSLLLRHLIVKRKHQSTGRYLFTTLDLAYVVVTLVGMSRIGRPYTFIGFIGEPPFLIIFLLNALSGLRFDFKASLYCALISILVVFGLGFYDIYSGLNPIIGGIMETVFKAALIGGTALVSGYIGHHSKDLIIQAIKEEEDKKSIKNIFGRYLSTEVMNSLIENTSALELGGERRTVTIMMTDLRGFTAMSERLEPEQVVQMLNTYIEAMVDVILKYNGMINEIIGDALLVIFGAPQELPDRILKAIACAIEMQNAMTEVNEENRTQGLPELEMGIGLNDAEVIVGSIGSSKRSKYAVVGSGVNITSRIESYTVGGQILISESVRKEAGDVLRIDDQLDVVPKGTEIPLKIYEVGGISGHYNLALDSKDPDLVILARQIPLQFTILECKDVGKKEIKGFIVRLSKNSAEITLGDPVEMMTNVKMNLVDVDENLSARNFYGKVIKRSRENGPTHVIHFTSVPPEINAYYNAFRQHAAT